MFTVAGIAGIAGGSIIGDADIEVCGVSTDSRTIRPGELFVPLQGERFDGHAYIYTMADRSVAVALAQESWLKLYNSPHSLTIISVKNTLHALGDLSAEFRRRHDIPLVGITGSNGKTTTKEMLAAIMEQLSPGLKTSGNLNNLIGVPQMLFRLDGSHGWAVLEMGMSEPGEIDRLAEIAAPQVGVVLNAYPAHLESMGSVENVAKAKGELLLRLPEGGCAIVNADDPLISLQPSPPGVRRITFGLSETSDIRALDITMLGIKGQTFSLIIGEESQPVSLSAFGSHSVYNALAAAAAASALGVSIEIIVSGLEAFRPYDKRFRLEETNGLMLIDDSYNANPASTGAALATVADIKGERKAFIVLGDMLELGSNEANLHRLAGIQAAQVADRLYLHGKLMEYAAEGAVSAGFPEGNIFCGLDHEQIAADILKMAQPGDLALVKGSRGMRMEKVAELIRQENR